MILTILTISGCSQKQELTQEQTDNTIIIKDFEFNPNVITVNLGTTITWINQDSAPHTIKFSNSESQKLNNGDSFKFQFNNKGTYDYICGLHPSMKAKIIVE